MTVQRTDPYPGSSFVVEIDGVSEVDIMRVELPRSELDEVAHREGAEPTREARKQPGLARYSRLVLHRSLDGRTDLYDWWSQARDGAPAVDRNVAVSLLDESRSSTVWRWEFSAAFPAAYYFSPLDAASSDIVIETIEIAFDRMRIE